MSSIETIKNTLQDCNLNFLIGSGLSCPLLPTLGHIERLLTELAERTHVPATTASLIRASLYKKYFDTVIEPNLRILSSAPETQVVQSAYQGFLNAVNSILLKRKTTILGKDVNLFTTNVDIFLDKALEDLGLECNDGFSGRFSPRFSLSNFKKSHFTKSSHYDNTAELPVFNLLKLHGSLSWLIDGMHVVFARSLAHVADVATRAVDPDHILAVPDDATLDSLLSAASGRPVDASIDAFIDSYETQLLIVNPTKDKFRHTLMNQTYYELLRLYSNVLEKENTILFAMGFSFADEHIRTITLRAANANPTLIIYVIAHSAQAHAEIADRLGTVTNNNVKIIAPDLDENHKDRFAYDLAAINARLFGDVLTAIGDEEPGPDELAVGTADTK